jgi:hypothetical protein
MNVLSTIILGVISALVAAAESGVELPDPTRPYAYAAAVEVRQDLPAGQVQWRLNGIRIREDERSAILNGTLVRAGDTVGGARVLEINPAEVVLLQDSQKVVVKLMLSGIKKPSRSADAPPEN